MPTSAGVVVMATTVNSPAPPLADALGCALALLPGDLARRKPGDLAWLVLDGVGLMPCLLLLRAGEEPR